MANQTEHSEDLSSQNVGSNTQLLSSNRLSLEDLKSMFGTTVDTEVVEMIWQDSNENSDIAVTFLTEMTCQTVPDVQLNSNSWSSVLGSEASKPFTVNQGVRPKSNTKSKHSMIDPIRNRIYIGEKIVVLMRGLPGSGKSFLAEQLQHNGTTLSTDEYFINYQGQYIFDRNLLQVAHEWNQTRANEEMKKGTNPIIIDNTNLEAWEMQPYIMMALRHGFSVELVEPETPWREDVRILSQKNTHRVPREKIRDMLEKFKVPIDIKAVTEMCRRKMNPNSNVTAISSTSSMQITPTEKVNCLDAELQVKPLPQRESRWNRNVPSSCTNNRISNDTLYSGENIEPSTIPPVDVSFSSNPDLTRKPDILESVQAESEGRPSTNEAAIQTSFAASEPSLRELTGRNRSIQTSRLVPNFNKSTRTKLTLDKGCLTDEIAEDYKENSREALLILKSYFPSKETGDLADILKQCNGDLTWAVNVLLDSGYECADEVSNVCNIDEDIAKLEDVHDFADLQEVTSSKIGVDAEEEINTFTSSETLRQSNSVPTTPNEDTEALRKHIEDCFHLSDSISEQTRRICGKDYNQFRASQLQKLRKGQVQTNEPSNTFHPSPFEEEFYKNGFACSATTGFPALDQGVPTELSLQESNIVGNNFGLDLLQPVASASPQISEDEINIDDGAMVSMSFDSSFIQQLVNLFGAPDLKTKKMSTENITKPVTFDIPLCLAEQIYMHWCSDMITKDEDLPQATEVDQSELKNIMDFEFAMQLVQDERNAERKELRESLSTKLSFQKLKENYPTVDPLALDALFEANNYNYAHTVTALNLTLGTKAHPYKTPSASSNSSGKEEATPKSPKRECKTESRDLRTEAFMYNRFRQQYSAQAQEYQRRGMSAAAMYYSSESRRYAELYRRCNQQAALQIVEEKNAHQDERTIDLHELHVVEALTWLESFIAENIRDGRTVIQVITGRGNNSQYGKPRIKPAVIAFLKQKKYGYEEINPGMLRVFLSRATRRAL